MAMFKVGDRVRRNNSAHAGMRVGDIGTVTQVDGHKIYLAEYTGVGSWAVASHADYNLELVRDEPAAPGGEADPTGRDPHVPGAKLDAGKLRPTLVIRDMARALEAVIKVATDGANKYTPGGWLEVPNASERYEDADLRHLLKRFKGEPVDPDSKSLHLAHNAWNALAKLELHLREQEGKKNEQQG